MAEKNAPETKPVRMSAIERLEAQLAQAKEAEKTRVKTKIEATKIRRDVARVALGKAQTRLSAIEDELVALEAAANGQTTIED